MNQTVILAIAIPLLIAGGVALWPAVTVPGGWAERERLRQTKTRQVLVSHALTHLRDLRVQLDGIFKESDEGRDPFLTKADPKDVSAPVQEYVRLTKLQQSLATHTRTARRLARFGFWVLIGFEFVMFAAVVLGVLVPVVGKVPGTLVIAGGAVVFVAGGVLFGIVLLQVRSIDAVHSAADDLGVRSDDPAYDDLLGEVDQV